VKLILAYSTACLLFAAEDLLPNPVAKYGELTALVIVGIVLIFLITKYLPSNQEKMAAMALSNQVALAGMSTNNQEKMAELSKTYTLSIEGLGKHVADVLDKMHDRSEELAKIHLDENKAMGESLRELTAQCAKRTGMEYQVAMGKKQGEG
jgi:hypothetical protein